MASGEDARREGVPLTGGPVYDQDLYGGGSKYAGYEDSLAADGEDMDAQPTAARHAGPCMPRP
jgi:hypothetical protein